jgi:putative two-component system response regulator
LQYLESSEADLILLDQSIPDMTGYRLIEKLGGGERTSGIPVIFLTNYENEEAGAHALDKGAVDYNTKPLNSKLLLTHINTQLELMSLRNDLEQMVREKSDQNVRRESIALNLLARATDMRDHETSGHITRTTEMVRIIVSDLLKYPQEGYSLTPRMAEDLVASTKLHDLGKIATPDNILRKPDKLDDEEFDVIKKHTWLGASLLDEYIAIMGNDSFLSMAREIAMHHHEKWDGSGYPGGLSGEEIPLSARITAIADVYDSLSSERPYKSPMDHIEAADIIVINSGTHFDPYLVTVFWRHEEKFRKLVEEIT